MPYTSKGKCVYKKGTEEKVGCTKGPIEKYLAALHANVPDAKDEGHIKLSDMVPQNEGDEERFGGGAYDREDNAASNKKPKICKRCGKKFVPSYGEYSRCQSCMHKEHGDGEQATGTQ